MRFFVYGIFLGQSMRQAYGMTVVGYDTVRNYITVGDHIVQACKVDGEVGASLTGLVVDVPERFKSPVTNMERDNIERLDALEGGYDRVQVVTTSGVKCWMYAEREFNREEVNDGRTETADSQSGTTA